MSGNPLEKNTDLPPFNEVKNEHMLGAIQKITQNNLEQIDRLCSVDAETGWSTIVELEKLDNRLGKAWAPISHLNAVKNSKELRVIFDECLQLLSDYSAKVNQNKALFKKYEGIGASENNLNSAQKKVVDDALRDFRLSGIDLPEDKQARYTAVRKSLSALGSKFDQNVLDATMAWSKHFSSAEPLKGLPKSALDSAQQAAKEKDLEGYLITLEYPSYFAVITYAEDEALRKEIYLAYTTRASEQGPHAGQFDNSTIMSEILELRQELAALLGFEHYAAYSLATKMADSVEQVFKFLEQLVSCSLAQGKKELAELCEYASSTFGVNTLNAWDVAFYSEKLRLHLFDISDEKLRSYFPEDKVIAGMFTITRELFGVSIEQKDSNVLWHPDVKYYEIFDNETGQKLAAFFLDLYARANKRGGAWMDDYQGRFSYDDKKQLPIAFLTCNFSAPTAAGPVTLTHNEVTTLFHEFGHGIHHMLTKVEYLSVSGINGVPWDAVELPSQFMENFCWQEESLALISSHVETGLPLPAEVLKKMLDARNFQSAMQMLRQLEFSLFDLRIHSKKEGSVDIQAELDQVRKEVAVLIPPSFNRFQHGFSHIFSGGYAAGYYSYKWAELLSADAFSKFEEEGILNKEVGASFKETVLANGGAVPPLDLFQAFRGREPTIDALLRHSGIS